MSQRAFLPAMSMALTLLVPMQLLGQESASGMVYANGSVTVNGTEIPKSVAVFPGDKLETKPDASATIGANGSSVMMFSDSLVRYEGTSVGVDRGSVRVNTSSGFEAYACEVKARPVDNTATQYQFTHNDGHVTVVAIKGDVFVEERHGPTTGQESKTDQESKRVKEGEQATRDDGCEVAKTPRHAPSAPSSIGNPKILYPAIGITGGVITWILLRGGHDHQPISPECPDPGCQ
jgi:hypothetical protein